MPIATPEAYHHMLDHAKSQGFAFPAVNCVGSEAINAALKGFADAGSDGIIQISTGGAEFASGLGIKDMVTGAVALAEFTQVVAARYPITVALHTDHCPKDKLDTYVRPLLEISQQRVDAGRDPLFNSHMWDGSAIPVDDNLDIAVGLLHDAATANVILEIEIGVVGGEEDGVEAAINDKLYTSDEDFAKTVDALGPSTSGERYLLAATFGNVHGVYKPGNVTLQPAVLGRGQQIAAEKLGLPAGSKPFDFVFHGGSGSLKSEIAESLNHGVVKMNIDTDTQHAFTRPVVDHMFTRYDQVLKIDGEVGNKTAYDPTRRYSSSQTVGGLTHPTSTGAESDEDIATRSAVAPVPSARGRSAGRMAGGVGTGERSRHASSTLIAVLPHRERDRLSADDRGNPTCQSAELTGTTPKTGN